MTHKLQNNFFKFISLQMSFIYVCARIYNLTNINVHFILMYVYHILYNLVNTHAYIKYFITITPAAKRAIN